MRGEVLYVRSTYYEARARLGFDIDHTYSHRRRACVYVLGTYQPSIKAGTWSSVPSVQPISRYENLGIRRGVFPQVFFFCLFAIRNGAPGTGNSTLFFLRVLFACLSLSKEPGARNWGLCSFHLCGFFIALDGV